MRPITDNTLFYGDNLKILRDYIPTESVDLVYLDPPFNSNRTYNVLFKDERGNDSEAQIVAFTDSWSWGPTAEQEYNELVTQGSPAISDMISALRGFIGSNPMMAYLVMMASRLMELHRVLKPTGSLYLHCDPTASHYLKIILDTIFGADHFLNEIVWHYTGGGRSKSYFSRKHDILLWYRVGPRHTFNVDAIRQPYKATSQYAKSGIMSASGKQYQPHPLGTPVDDVWDIPIINPLAHERLGYPTQKPLILLERIIQASSNLGDIVLDPFCGGGTTIAAAQKLGRRWIGIDITHLSIALQKYRLAEMYPGLTFNVIGEPEDVGAAHQLFNDNPYQFQWWALSMIHARPYGADGSSKQGKKGPDGGIDGIINFIDDAAGKTKKVIIQVKGGKVQASVIRDLIGVLDATKGVMGVLITLEPPTKPMRDAATTAGFYESQSWGRKYPRVQIVTIAELFAGKEIAMPPAYGTFKQVQRVDPDTSNQQDRLDV
ncbi:DNA methyltransferase [Herpetosiphon geysericola]|uniref:Methyltransferase n=1 Tax=Herpetosiphon geysericola TaxID=70996 RepID=A0A0P6XTM3_9CHLR|nr:DNA methyltransferase [Herpetosiphon geysericola]KPL79942.1 hypothetical protein SE18_25450 [Herpetosiphon geysericola]